MLVIRGWGRQPIEDSGQDWWGRGWRVELGKTSGREEVGLGGTVLRKTIDGNRGGHRRRTGRLDGRGRMTRPDAVALGVVARDARSVVASVRCVMVRRGRCRTGVERLHRPAPETGGEQQEEQGHEASTLDSSAHGPKLRQPPPRAKRSRTASEPRPVMFSLAS